MCSRTDDLITFGTSKDEPLNILQDMSWFEELQFSVYAETKVFQESMRKLEDELQKTRSFQIVHSLLTEAGINFRTYDWMYTFIVGQVDLPKVYKAVGKLEFNNKYVKCEKTGTITVSLFLTKYPGCQLQYDTLLKPGDRCKIVTNYFPSSQVVCSK